MGAAVVALSASHTCQLVFFHSKVAHFVEYWRVYVGFHCVYNDARTLDLGYLQLQSKYSLGNTISSFRGEGGEHVVNDLEQVGTALLQTGIEGTIEHYPFMWGR